MIWVLLSMAVIILSIAVMVKGWDDLHGGMFHGGLIMIAIGIISISASIFYMNEGNIKNMENMKNVYKFKRLNEMKLDDYGFGLFEYNGALYFKEADGGKCFDVRSGNEVIIGKDKIIRQARGSNAALFVELRSKASGETGRPRFVYIYHLVNSTL